MLCVCLLLSFENFVKMNFLFPPLSYLVGNRIFQPLYTREMGFQELQHGLRLMNIHINRDDWQVCLSLLAYVFSRQTSVVQHMHTHMQ